MEAKMDCDYSPFAGQRLRQLVDVGSTKTTLRTKNEVVVMTDSLCIHTDSFPSSVMSSVVSYTQIQITNHTNPVSCTIRVQQYYPVRHFGIISSWLWLTS